MSRYSLKMNIILNTCRMLLSVLFPLITFPYTSRIFLTEGSGQLTEGITAYTDGVGQVYEGSTKLNNATYELTQTADDLETAVDRIQALKDTDATYENYGGIEEGKTGSVTFIVETAEIKAEK